MVGRTEMGEGERLHNERRKRFWRIMGGLVALGFVTGIVAQFAMSISASGQDWPAWAPVAASIGVVLVAVAVAYASWHFFVSVDEVEVADNLWASLIGYYAYIILFPAWWALHKLGQVPEPNHWAILLVSGLLALAVYAYRKVRYN